MLSLRILYYIDKCHIINYSDKNCIAILAAQTAESGHIISYLIRNVTTYATIFTN